MQNKMKVEYLYVPMEHYNECHVKKSSPFVTSRVVEKIQYEILFAEYALKAEFYTASDTWY
jgi:hypothetical protein